MSALKTSQAIKAYFRESAPGLTRVYRKYLFLWRDLRKFPSQLAEIGALKRGHPLESSETGKFLMCNYHDGEPTEGQEGIISMFDGKLYHGGLTDRLRGILTTYREAERRHIPFHILWTEPFDLSLFLEPASDIDWRITPEEVSRAKADAVPVVIWETNEPQSHINNRLMLDAALHNHRRQTHVYSNAANAKGDYRRLYCRLFRPTPALQSEVDRNLELIGANYHSFSFRFLELLGDFTDLQKTTLYGEEKERFIARVLDEFLNLAAGVPDGYRILVTSDSSTFLQRAKEADPRVFTVPGEIRHVDFQSDPDRNVWMKTFVDQHLIMHAKKAYLLRTGGMYRSGFPEFAAEVGGVPFVDHRF